MTGRGEPGQRKSKVRGHSDTDHTQEQEPCWSVMATTPFPENTLMLEGGLAKRPVCSYGLRSPGLVPLTTDRLDFSERQGRSRAFPCFTYLVNDLVLLVGSFTVFRSQVKFTNPSGFMRECTSH